MYGDQKRQNPLCMNYREIIADNLSKAGWSRGGVFGHGFFDVTLCSSAGVSPRFTRPHPLCADLPNLAVLSGLRRALPFHTLFSNRGFLFLDLAVCVVLYQL
jgi:hypothetical protein